MNELKEWQGVDISDIDFTYHHKEQCPKCASEGGAIVTGKQKHTKIGRAHV